MRAGRRMMIAVLSLLMGLVPEVRGAEVGIPADLFVAKAQNHIQKVERIGVEAWRELVRRYPGEYNDLTELEVRGILRRHDQAKINRTAQFRHKYGLDGKPLIPDMLSRFYGAQREELEHTPSGMRGLPGAGQRSQWNDLQDSIALLNRTDHQVINEYLAPFSIEKRQKLLSIESLADLLHTSAERNVEFGGRLKPASEFIAEQIRAGKLKHLGRYADRLPGLARYFEETLPTGVTRVADIINSGESRPTRPLRVADRSRCLYRAFVH